MIELIDVYEDGVPRAGAISFLYELLTERPSHANISHQGRTTLEDHTHFVLSEPYRHWLLIIKGRNWAGATYLTHRNEVGIAIAKPYQRQGLARQALDMVTLFPPLSGVPGQVNPHYVANVAGMNHVSRHLFESMGWQPIQVTYRKP